MDRSDSETENGENHVEFDKAIREIRRKEKELNDRTRILENMMQTFASYIPRTNLFEPHASTSGAAPSVGVPFAAHMQQQTPSPGTGISNFSYPAAHPKSYLRDALELVPKYDGHNIPVWQFARACKRAKETVPLIDETLFVRMLRNKLTHHAYLAVEDEIHPTVDKFLDCLKRIFGSGRSANYYRGQLSMAYKKPNEHILDYIGRIKDLKNAIIEGDQTNLGRLLSEIELCSIESYALEAFFEGLPREYRIELLAEGYNGFSDACSKVLLINRRLEREEFRYKNTRNSRENTTSTPPIRVLQRDTPTTQNDPRNPVRPGLQKICGYCNKMGHLIHECRRRQYQQQYNNISSSNNHNNNNRSHFNNNNHDHNRGNFNTNNNYPRTNNNHNNNNHNYTNGRSNFTNNYSNPSNQSNNNNNVSNNHNNGHREFNTNNNNYAGNRSPNSNNNNINTAANSGNSPRASVNGMPRGHWNAHPVQTMEVTQGPSTSSGEMTAPCQPLSSNLAPSADRHRSCSIQEHNRT